MNKILAFRHSICIQAALYLASTYTVYDNLTMLIWCNVRLYLMTIITKNMKQVSQSSLMISVSSHILFISTYLYTNFVHYYTCEKYCYVFIENIHQSLSVMKIILIIIISLCYYCIRFSDNYWNSYLFLCGLFCFCLQHLLHVFVLIQYWLFHVCF